MTVLVGVKCKDAIIVGSDSAVSATDPNNFLTVEHPGKKISIIDNHVIVAGTGSIGFGQRFEDVTTKFWRLESAPQRDTPVNFSTELSRLALLDFQRTFAVQQQLLNYGALVAFPLKSKLELCEFEYPRFQPELKTESSWYVSMGGAQPIADALLGFACRVFWPDGPPNKEAGIFAAIWVLSLTIEMFPSGVSAPIQMAVLEKSGTKRPTARYLSKEEIDRHESQIEPLMEYFGRYKDQLRQPVSPPPTSP